jgi:hypothetical protein
LGSLRSEFDIDETMLRQADRGAENAARPRLDP